MKKILLNLLFILICYSSFSAVLVEDSVLLRLNKQQIDSLYTANGVPTFLFPSIYEVEVHRVVYNTLGADNNPTIASGLIIVPVGDTCPAPLISYQHGTVARKDDVFSNLRGEWIVGVAAAATGYVATMPDYIGLGVSPGFHPYQHAKTEAYAVVDILRGAKEIVANKNIELSGELYLLGYSQGGHATMAAHREIQQFHSSEFTVTAAAPLSGAYDMSGAQFDFIASFDPYSQPGYLPYVILAFQYVYGNLYNDISEIFVEPYDSLIPILFDGTNSFGDINTFMNPVPRLMIDTAYANAFFADSLHPARVALRDNDVYRWVPQAPVRMGYCTLDEEVNFLNAFVARDSMIARGATDVSIRNNGELAHFACAQPSILFSKFWFDSLSVSRLCNVSGIFSPKFENVQISVYPNPATDKTIISFDNKEKENFNVYVLNTSGAILTSQKNVTENNAIVDVKNLSSGIYIVLVEGKNKSYWGRLVKAK